jgi:1-acyl-sn-glycerol-3-phosphate acyltransferase
MGTADAYLREHPELLDVDLTSERTLDRNVRAAALLEKYFRFSLTGREHVPDEPCIVVANHSIGSPFVLPLLARAWRLQFGSRPARGLMHRVAWQWPFRQIGLLQRLGGIYAHPTVAARALAKGNSLLVFPGGDVDAMRPFHERYRVKFGTRTGFVRLARATNTKLVPLAICGSQSAYVSLPGAALVARAVGLHRWTGLRFFPLTLGVVALGTTLAVPLLWPFAPALALLAAAPMPTRIEARFLPPMTVDPGESDREAAERVRSALEREVGAMATRRTTFLG